MGLFDRRCDWCNARPKRFLSPYCSQRCATEAAGAGPAAQGARVAVGVVVLAVVLGVAVVGLGSCVCFSGFLLGASGAGRAGSSPPPAPEVAATPASPSAEPTAVRPTSATPASTSLVWAPLVRPWSRLYIEPACDTEAYGSLSAVDEMTWAPAGAEAFTLRVTVRNEDASEPDGPIMEDQTVSLTANGTPIANMHVLTGTCAEAQATVVYAGERTDGLLLVSMEALPQRTEGMALPGTSHRYLFGVDNGAIAQRATWDGETADVPQLFRIREQ